MGVDSRSNLEMRCSVDGAWYDGSLSFGKNSKDVIVVHFNDFGEEEDERLPSLDLLDCEKLKSRVRVRSEQLQDVQCKLVNEGQLICGCLDDGENRKYYDAKVISIVKKDHSFSDEGEECKCNFKLLWLDGPRKGKQTPVGCAEVCFLSTDSPEDDPMVKNLVKRLSRNREQRGRLPAPKPLSSPRPRTPSPTQDVTLSKKQGWRDTSIPNLELSPSKKQSSKAPSPSSTKLAPLKKQPNSKDDSPPALPNLRVRVGQQASTKSEGSKKKRIMQAKIMEHSEAFDNDASNNLDADARPLSIQIDGSGEGSERRGIGGESPKKGFLSAERKRLVKVKSLKVAVTPVLEVGEELPSKATGKSMSFRELVKFNTRKVGIEDDVACDDVAVREEDDFLRPAKKRVKSSIQKVATEVTPHGDKAIAVGEGGGVIQRSVHRQVKVNTSGKKGDPNVAAPLEKPAVDIQDDVPHSSSKEGQESNTMKKSCLDVAVVHENMTLGERVKLKSLQKSKSVEASPLKKSRVTSKKKALENELEVSVSSMPNEATRPNDVAVRVPRKQPKRKASRPRKRAVRKLVPKSLASTKQSVVEFCKEQGQNSQQEEVIDAIIVEKQALDLPIKRASKLKRSREEPLLALVDVDGINQDNSKQGEDTLEEPQRVTKQACGNEEREIGGMREHDGQQIQIDDALSDKSAADDKDHTPVVKKTRRLLQLQSPLLDCDKFTQPPTEDKDHSHVSGDFDANSERLGKKSLADSYNDIEQKYRSNCLQVRDCGVEKALEVEDAMMLGSSKELIGSHQVSNQIQENLHISGLKTTETPIEVDRSGKRRLRQVVLTDDEEELAVEAVLKEKKNRKELHGSVNSSANGQEYNDPKMTSTSALDKEVVVQQQEGKKATRLLLIRNMETGATAYDAMQLLQEHTEGVCAVHVLPVDELQSSAVGYALYKDNGFALKAFQHLAAPDRFVISSNGRPWIISQSYDTYGPHLCGFFAQTAFKSDDPHVCGIISDQPPIEELLVVTKQRDYKAYSQALHKSKAYAKHQQWRKELYDRIIEDEMKG